jgi:hypothetical protein
VIVEHVVELAVIVEHVVESIMQPSFVEPVTSSSR